MRITLMWHYRKTGLMGESTEGPIADAEIMALCYSARVTRKTLISHPQHTKGQWIEAASVPNFVKKFEAGERDREAEKQRVAAEKEADRARVAQETAEKKRLAAEKLEVQRLEAAAEQQRIQQQSAKQHQLAQQQQAHATASAPAPAQPQVVVVNNSAPQSQAVPALASFFFPGLGQLIQGRVIAAAIFFTGYTLALASICVGVGIFLVPIVAILAVVDAAWYSP